VFCRNCGKELIGTAEYCPYCGAKPLAPHSFYPETKGGKSKATSVLLAVFLSFWTWLYTYKKDAWKFWVGLALAIFDIILAVVTFGVSFVFTWIFTFGVWIWAIVDTALKKDEWYSSYS
jgi:hypothetical protein